MREQSVASHTHKVGEKLEIVRNSENEVAKGPTAEIATNTPLRIKFNRILLADW